MRSIVILACAIILVGCTPPKYLHILEVRSTDVPLQQGFFSHGNDTIHIYYDFWGDGGPMEIAVQNKLDKPLYIDWKKSSVVTFGEKTDLWHDGETRTQSSVSGGVERSTVVIGKKFVLGFGSSSETLFSKASVVRPERITFIPPKSIIRRSTHEVLPLPTYKVNTSQLVRKDTTVSQYDPVARLEKLKVVPLLSYEFPEGTSPIDIRFYLTYSTSESFQIEHAIDNKFFVNRVSEMEVDKNTKLVDRRIPSPFYLIVDRAYSFLRGK